MSNFSQALPSIGVVERCGLRDGVLRVSGWCASKGAGSLEDAVLTYRGEDVAAFDLATKLPSEDVSQLYPDLAEGHNCRFEIAAAPGALEPDQAGVLTLTPVCDQKPGRMLTHVPQPQLPVSDEEEARLVGGSCVTSALEFLGYFIQFVELKPKSDVLEVGCGLGRMAYGLAHYVNSDGHYEGFDIVDRLIRWAQCAIGRHVPTFHFRTVDLYNRHYNPAGCLQPSQFVFPYDNEQFEFVFGTSVFTHMYAKDICHYVGEISRVLRPGGRCLLTSCLLTEESVALIAAGKSMLNLVFQLQECFTVNPEVPEDARGIRESLLLSCLARHGLEVHTIGYGSWCGRQDYVSLQDIIICEKAQRS